MLLARGTPCFWMVREERCEEDAMSKQSCFCAHVLGKSSVFETLWSQIVCLQASPWSWLSQSASKAAHGVSPGELEREETAGRNGRLSVRGDIFNSGANTPIKIDPDPFFRVCKHKKNNKKYYYWLLQDKMGKSCEKKKKIWARISACSMVKGAVVGMFLNLWPRKDSFFVFCTHTGLSCALPVGVLPCVASLDFSA